MKIGDRVRLSEYGKDEMDWSVRDIEGTISGKHVRTEFSHYDWYVWWDDDREGDTIAHYENELEEVL